MAGVAQHSASASDGLSILVGAPRVRERLFFGHGYQVVHPTILRRVRIAAMKHIAGKPNIEGERFTMKFLEAAKAYAAFAGAIITALLAHAAPGSTTFTVLTIVSVIATAVATYSVKNAE